MNLKEIKEILEMVVEKGFTEFELERSGMRIRLKREGPRPNPGPPQVLGPGPVISYAPLPVPPAALPGGAAPPSATAAPAEPAAEKPKEEELHIVKSPIVGTFYQSPSPEAPPFVKIGDTVSSGQTLCIIEAMKLMNEIEADVAGEIVRRFVENGQPVEYGQPLFSIREK